MFDDIFNDLEFKKCASYNIFFEKYKEFKKNINVLTNINTNKTKKCLNKKNINTYTYNYNIAIKIKINNIIYILHNNKIYNIKGVFIGFINKDNIIINNKKIIIKKFINVEKNKISKCTDYIKDKIYIDSMNNLYKSFENYVFLIGEFKDNEYNFYYDDNEDNIDSIDSNNSNDYELTENYLI